MIDTTGPDHHQQWEDYCAMKDAEQDAAKPLDAKDQEIHRLRQIITFAYEKLRDEDGYVAYAILRDAAMAFPSVPQAPTQ